MKKTELVNAVAEEIKKKEVAELSNKAVEEILDITSEVIVSSVEEGKTVKFAGLKIVRVLRKARVGRNMQTGEPLDIPAAYVYQAKQSGTTKKRYKAIKIEDIAE